MRALENAALALLALGWLIVMASFLMMVFYLAPVETCYEATTAGICTLVAGFILGLSTVLYQDGKRMGRDQ